MTAISDIAKKAIKTGQSVRELLHESGKFTDEQLAFLDKYSTFNDDMLGELANNKDMWDMYADYMDGFAANTELFEATVQALMDFKSQELDKEIDALTAQKDALGEINDERKKEIELIKAKDALENAKKEKKMVYRAGELLRPLITISVKSQKWLRPR